MVRFDAEIYNPRNPRFVFSARMARAHNDANVLALGGRVLGVGLAGEIVRAFFAQDFEGGRHERRVGKIMALENK